MHLQGDPRRSRLPLIFHLSRVHPLDLATSACDWLLLANRALRHFSLIRLCNGRDSWEVAIFSSAEVNPVYFWIAALHFPSSLGFSPAVQSISQSIRNSEPGLSGPARPPAKSDRATVGKETKKETAKKRKPPTTGRLPAPEPTQPHEACTVHA